MEPDRVRVPFAIETPEGRIEASIVTTAEEAPVAASVVVARAVDDLLIARAVARTAAKGAPVSCRRGCAACCHQVVPVVPVEAHALLALVESWDEAEQARVEARFDAAKAHAEAAGLLEPLRDVLAGGELEIQLDWIRKRIRCPFLGDDDACSIYDHRPLACREHLVTSDPARCEEPELGAVHGVPLLSYVGDALGVVSLSTWPEAPLRVPLLLCLDWARAHRAEGQARRPGVDVVTELLTNL